MQLKQLMNLIPENEHFKIIQDDQNQNITIIVDNINFISGNLRIYINYDVYNPDRPIEITDDGDSLIMYHLPLPGIDQIGVKRSLIELTHAQQVQVKLLIKENHLELLPINLEICTNCTVDQFQTMLIRFIEVQRKLAHFLPQS